MSKGVIETFFLDWPFCFGTGLLFGLAGRAEIARASSPLRTRAFRYGFTYLHLGILSVAISFYLLRPDWMWMYWVQAARMPVVVVMLAFAMYEACFIAGFALGPWLGVKTGRALILAGTVAVVAGEVAARSRLLHLGSYAAFTSGARGEIRFSPLHLAPLGWVLLVLIPVSTFIVFGLASRVAAAGIALTEGDA
ncbi:MAG: hypothetical protein ABR552_08455 [Actinomycetota bacterium]